MSAIARRRTAAAVPIIMLFSVLQFVLFSVDSVPAGATHVEPVLYDSNVNCSVIADGDEVLRLEPGRDAVEGIEIDGVVYELTVEVDESDNTFDWSSSDGLLVQAVFAKGGSGGGGNMYDYQPFGGETSDTNLHAPANPNGRFAGLSHITFCVDVENPTTTIPTPDEVTVDVSGECVYDGTASFVYTVAASAGVTVDFDGVDQNLEDGETYVSASGSASWEATAPPGSVFAGTDSATAGGTENVADCTPPGPGEVTVNVSGECRYDGVASFVYTVAASVGVTVDFDGVDQNLEDGETYVSASGSASWEATAPPGSVFAGTESATARGTENVADCTPPTNTGVPTPSPALGAIGDLVWFDENRDGAQDSPIVEFPISGATVSLLAPNGGVLAQQVTGSDGLYLFDGLSAGNYRVEVCVAGARYTATNALGVAKGLDSDVFPLADNAPCARTGLINLPSGVTDLTWDAGLVLEVRGIQVESTTTAPSTTVEPATADTLPFTGERSNPLVVWGMFALVLGASLLGVSSFDASLLRVGRHEAAPRLLGRWQNR